MLCMFSFLGIIHVCVCVCIFPLVFKTLFFYTRFPYTSFFGDQNILGLIYLNVVTIQIDNTVISRLSYCLV